MYRSGFRLRKVVPCWMVVLLLPTTGWAFTPSPPEEQDVLSENGQYLARVTPGTSHWDRKQKKWVIDVKTRLRVFRTKGRHRELFWQCDLINESSPGEARVSDDGRSVVTFDDHPTSGYGDKVVVIYGPKGLLRKYTLESVLGLTRKEIMLTGMRHGLSARFWDYCAVGFFDRYEGRSLFCLWVHFPPRWLCWDLADGRMRVPDKKMIARWNARGRDWAKGKLKGEGFWDSLSAIAFLGAHPHPKDRPVIEGQLHDRNFMHCHASRGEESYFEIRSYERKMADRVLARWDKLTVASIASDDDRYFMLGSIRGTIRLPLKPDKRDGMLWIHLVPESVRPDRWASAHLEHAVGFHLSGWGVGRPSRTVDYRWYGVVPGKYWIKVVWDKASPHAKKGAKLVRPGTEDFQSSTATVFEVVRGRVVKVQPVECDRKVTSASKGR